MTSKAFGLIGLAQRAGKLLSGTDLCEKAAKEGKAKLILMDRETAANTREKITRAAAMGEVPLMETPEGLGDAIGKPGRVIVAVMDAGFAGAIEKALGNESA